MNEITTCMYVRFIEIHVAYMYTLNMNFIIKILSNFSLQLFARYSYRNHPIEWRLFIDSSSRSLKAVLLHNGNQYPSLLVAHSVHLKEDYTSAKMLLSALKYNDHGWEVIGDFKMVSFLMGLQGGFTKFPCFLCLWDSRDTEAHYRRRDWPQ